MNEIEVEVTHPDGKKEIVKGWKKYVQRMNKEKGWSVNYLVQFFRHINGKKMRDKRSKYYGYTFKRIELKQPIKTESDED